MANMKTVVYRESYVAFLDVLGFENLVKSDASESKSKLECYFKLINEEVKELKKFAEKRDIGALIISDSVILSVEKTTSHPKNTQILRQLCIAIKKIQFRLALNGLWLRGGVSSGKAYFSPQNNQIVGPAYIDAYNLENRVAIYPRVILDSRLINELEYNSAEDLITAINDSRDDDILFPWSEDLHRHAGMQKDVALFVDYLATSFAKIDDLTKVIDNIEEAIYEDNQVYSKYRWVTEYLLSKCLQVQERHSMFQSQRGEKELQNIHKQSVRLKKF